MRPASIQYRIPATSATAKCATTKGSSRTTKARPESAACAPSGIRPLPTTPPPISKPTTRGAEPPRMTTSVTVPNERPETVNTLSSSTSFASLLAMSGGVSDWSEIASAVATNTASVPTLSTALMGSTVFNGRPKNPRRRNVKPVMDPRLAAKTTSLISARSLPVEASTTVRPIRSDPRIRVTVTTDPFVGARRGRGRR